MLPLVVPATMDSLGRIGQHVLQSATAAGLDKKRAYRLRLAVDEIATNIVEHGYHGGDENGQLTVSSQLSQDALVITLEDQSIAFDPRGLEVKEEVYLSQPLEERPIGQLGILLALQGVDQFDYQSAPLCNQSIFLMRLQEDKNVPSPHNTDPDG